MFNHFSSNNQTPSLRFLKNTFGKTFTERGSLVSDMPMKSFDEKGNNEMILSSSR